MVERSDTTGPRPSQGRAIPGGIAEVNISLEKSRIVTNARFFQERNQLLRKRSRSMMRLLTGDIATHRLQARRAYRECGVAFLPLKLGVAFLNPCRRCLFQFPEQFCKAGGRGKRREKVDMIGHAADLARNCTEPVEGAPNVRVQVVPPFGSKTSSAVFGGKNDVVVKGCVRGGHCGNIFWRCPVGMAPQS